MKNLKTPVSVVVALTLVFFWTSCKKDISQQPTDPNNQESLNARAFGAVEDNADVISKVPMIVSAEFLANSEDFLYRRSIGGVIKGGGKRDATPPTVSITSPANGETVSGTIDVLVSASDNVGVKSVSLSVDGTVVGSNINSPFTNSWNSGAVANGTHTLGVTATDGAGNKATSSIQVTVNNVAASDLTSPTVSISSPANGSAFDPNVSVTVNVGASANVGVSSISLSVDGTAIGSSNSSSGSFSWHTGAVSGPHTLTATAYDAAGNQGTTSISVTVNTVVLPPSPPGTLPSSANIAMPAVLSQGSESACVTFAVIYARDAEQYYKTGSSSYSGLP